MGEVGLAGEVRAVTGLEARLKEAAALGFTAAVVPQSSLTAGVAGAPLDVQGVGSVDEAVKVLLGTVRARCDRHSHRADASC